MKRTTFHRSGFLLMLLLCAMSSALSDNLRVFELQSRPAADLVPLLQPLMRDGTRLVADGYKLIASGSQTDLATIDNLLKQLDKSLANLLFEVRTVGARVKRSSRNSVRVEAGADTRVVIDARRTSTKDRDVNGFAVRALEGQPALIRLGEERVSGHKIDTRRGHIVSKSDRVQQIDRGGMYVTARLRGDDVQLSISTQAQGSNRTYQHVATQLQGRLGEWITIAGVERTSSTREGASVSAGSGTRETQIRVSRID